MKVSKREEKGTDNNHLPAETHTKKDTLRGLDVLADLQVHLKAEIITKAKERFPHLTNLKMLIKF